MKVKLAESKFKRGDVVKYKHNARMHYGEITDIRFLQFDAAKSEEFAYELSNSNDWIHEEKIVNKMDVV